LVNIAAGGLNRNDKFWSAIRFAQVQAAKRERRRRAAYLPSEVLAEPAWDILLELYAFELVGRAVSQTEISERIQLPSTTSVRWTKVLEAADLIVRAVDPDEPLSVKLVMSPKALEAMEAYFSDVD
jgi:DNA-binding MarR family transcriptional regulator